MERGAPNGDGSLLVPMNLETLHDWLREYSGLDPASIGEDVLQELVRDRISMLRCSSLKGYLDHLSGSAQERLILIERLVVPETWFFRDRPSLEFAAQYAIKTWSKSHPKGPFRVLFMPCWTGEEPYSLAMAFAQAGWPLSRLRIEAIDISRDSIRTAREGFYHGDSFRPPDLDFRETQLVPVRADTWRVPDDIRAAVLFEQASLTAPGFVGMRVPYDAIFCRNLFFHMDSQAQSKAISVVNSLLQPEGIVAAGASELELLRKCGYRPVDDLMPFVMSRVKAFVDPQRFR